MHCEHTVTTMQCWRKKDLSLLGLRLNVFAKDEILNKIWLPEWSTCFSFQNKKFSRLFTIFQTLSLFFRLFPGRENWFANFQTFSRIQDSVRTLRFSFGGRVQLYVGYRQADEVSKKKHRVNPKIAYWCPDSCWHEKKSDQSMSSYGNWRPIGKPDRC